MPDAKFTVDISGNSIREIDKRKRDNHHIFPKARVNNFSQKSKFNSIANIVLIDSTINRVDIKDKSPSEYFPIIKLQSKGEFNCDQNLIDINKAIQIDSEKEAEIFIDKRAEKIAEIINFYFV